MVFSKILTRNFKEKHSIAISDNRGGNGNPAIHLPSDKKYFKEFLHYRNKKYSKIFQRNFVWQIIILTKKNDREQSLF